MDTDDPSPPRPPTVTGRKPLPTGQGAGTGPRAVANRVPLPAGSRELARDFQTELQVLSTRILADPYRSKYSAVHVLFVYFELDEDPAVKQARELLKHVLTQRYNYAVEEAVFPVDAREDLPWRQMTKFVQEEQDALKIVHYTGASFLDRDGRMVLAR